TEWRRLFMNSLQHELRNASGELPQAQNLRIRFIPGWRAETLRQAMDQHKQNERRIGRSVVGPQRDDWTVMVGDQSARLMSRGQMKLVGLLLVRARGRLMQQAGRGSILLLDDLPADLDAQSLRLAVNLLQDGFIQIWLSWVSGINGDQALAPCDVEWFHVEPGLVQKST
ncbi:MAG TPA: hypothetical protein VFW83_08715, partial [Bryobacteraceae bacterium]|nr:hypothetical protein [Bryobacteraceae bacterium]